MTDTITMAELRKTKLYQNVRRLILKENMKEHNDYKNKLVEEAPYQPGYEDAVTQYKLEFDDWLNVLQKPQMLQYDQVFSFRSKLNLPVSDVPALLPSDQLSFYARFIMEELSELMKAHEKGRLIDAADAVVDLLYVTMGLSHHMGLPLPELFQAVHRANMKKQPGMTKRGIGQDAIKPDNWKPPEDDIAAILYRNRK